MNDLQYWKDELRRYREIYREAFEDRGDKIIDRYRDTRKDSETGTSRYNILWSNVRTLKPAMFAKAPKPEASRRFKDNNPAARCASQIIERALSYEITQFFDYESALSNAVDDRLLPGRGVAWVRYEPTIESIELEPQITEDVEVGGEGYEPQMLDQITGEHTPVDYVFWKDFAHTPARTWDEVTWIARRVYLEKDEVVARFGEEFSDIPLVNQPKDKDKAQIEKDQLKKAEIWEIWCKTSKQVYWLSEHYDKMLDARPDPLELESFFPCPRPLYSTVTTDSLVPVADFTLYQDQARELDEISDRIRHLTRALQSKGVYAAEAGEIARLLKEGADGDMIPVQNWQAFTEKGGIKGAFELLDLTSLVNTLQELYRDRDALKQTIYEITGISDIVRGASNASETATAQQIKSQFASIRLSEMKNDVARFARDILKIKAEIMCSKYQPQSLIDASGILYTEDAQYAAEALQLLKNEPMRNFQIDIESDSLVELDQQQEKQDRIEFLTAASSYLEKAVTVSQAAPSLAPLLGEMMLFGIRGFSVGKSIEGAFEQAIDEMRKAQQQPQQPAPPSDEEIKAQADMQLQAQQQQHEQQMALMTEHFERWKTELQESTKLIIAQISAQTAKETAATAAANQEFTNDISGQL